MGRARRGGYVIDWWLGDHDPKHVHIYKDGTPIAKVEMPSRLVLSGRLNSKLRKILEQLIKEGVL